MFKVCDQPHPELIRSVVRFCLKGNFDKACTEVNTIFDEGYTLLDIVQTISRVIQNSDEIPNDSLRLSYLKETSIVKMRTLEGVAS